MSWIKNLAVVLVSFFVSFMLAELVVRMVTDYPSYDNKVIDARFGYKVNSKFKDVDELGFRNADGKINEYEIAAIGDSHTYGYNVISEDAWPSQLESLIGVPVYNFGIGGNGIYSYHYLVKEALKNNKTVIVGLYLPNDFQIDGYVCSIDFNNAFWVEEVDSLQLDLPESCGSSKKAGKKKSVFKEIARESAMLSMAKDYIQKPLKRMARDDEPVVSVYERFSPIETRRLEEHSVSTDLDNPEISSAFADFKKMAIDWKKLSKNGHLGVVLIPSRQSVYRAALEQLALTPDNQNLLQGYTDNELELEKELFDLFRSLDIPVLSVKVKTVDEFIDKLPSEGVERFYPDSGHPDVAGYKAYAETAAELYREMSLARDNDE